MSATTELAAKLKAAIRGEGEPGHPGEMISVVEAEYLIDEVFAEAAPSDTDRLKRIEVNPPDGWFVFGTHIDDPTPLEFYGGQFTEAGMPMWERPAMRPVRGEVTTVEELEALPIDSVILGYTPDGVLPIQNAVEGWLMASDAAALTVQQVADGIARSGGPATVLYRPAALGGGGDE